MIVIRPGSHVHRLITILGVTGEFPTSALHLIGNERVVKAYVHALESIQVLRNDITGEEARCRLITISGKAAGKTIRFHKSGLPILNWIHPKALELYLAEFRNHRFSGDDVHKDRNHRKAEVVAMCARAGIEFRPYMLPDLQKEGIRKVVPDKPSYYGSKDIKQIADYEINKTAYARPTGMLFSPGEARAVYNLRNMLMKWNGKSEEKIRLAMTDIARLNARLEQVYDAVMFGRDYDVAIRLLEGDAKLKKQERFDSVYRHVHFIPQTEFGIQQLRTLLIPNWREQILNATFEDETRSYDRGSFEFDACVDGVYYLAFFDGDLARLIRFKEAAKEFSDGPRTVVLCFPQQLKFLREYLPRWVALRILDMEELEDALGIREQGGVI